jgi:UDP-sugar pyrophosphorylase
MNHEKTIFESTARVECTMQDYPKLLSSIDKVGYTMFESWYCFSPPRNNSDHAANRNQDYTSTETELNIYRWASKILSLVGVQVEQHNENQ